jgi:hypothetical protein
MFRQKPSSSSDSSAAPSLRSKMATGAYLVLWIAAAVVLWITWLDLSLGAKILLTMIEVFLAPDLFESIERLRSRIPSDAGS